MKLTTWVLVAPLLLVPSAFCVVTIHRASEPNSHADLGGLVINNDPETLFSDMAFNAGEYITQNGLVCKSFSPYVDKIPLTSIELQMSLSRTPLSNSID
jgi:hypothetical protein